MKTNDFDHLVEELSRINKELAKTEKLQILRSVLKFFVIGFVLKSIDRKLDALRSRRQTIIDTVR